MNINRQNYEVYVVDYFDGKLNPAERAELMYFLSVNPDLEDEFNNFGEHSVPIANFEFKEKESLKKNMGDISSVSEKNFDEFCIAAFEGDLDKKSEEKLEYYLMNHPEKRKDYETYGKLKLVPDKKTVYPYKTQLTKQVIKPLRILYFGISAAAAILFAVFLINHKPYNRPIPEGSLYSETETKQEVPENFTPATPEKPVESPIIALSGTKKTEQIYEVDFSEIKRTKPAEPLLPIVTEKIENHFKYGQSLAHSYAREIPFEISKPADSKPSLQLDRFNLISLAEAGIRGVNYLTESDIRFEKKTDDNGKVVEFGFESQRFGFSTQRIR
jgi:hypothetical protein